MENIFKGAKHLDAFLTKNGRKAILVYTTNDNDYELWVEGCYSSFSYKANGKRYVRQFGDEYDIVSKYEEPINENIVQKLGNHYLEIIREPDDESSKVSFTTGYRMGWVHMTEFADYLKTK